MSETKHIVKSVANSLKIQVSFLKLFFEFRKTNPAADIAWADLICCCCHALPILLAATRGLSEAQKYSDAGVLWVNRETEKGEQYFPYLKSRKAVIIKFADRLSNLSRMDDWPGDWQMNYLNKSKFWETQPPQ